MLPNTLEELVTGPVSSRARHAGLLPRCPQQQPSDQTYRSSQTVAVCSSVNICPNSRSVIPFREDFPGAECRDMGVRPFTHKHGGVGPTSVK